MKHTLALLTTLLLASVNKIAADTYAAFSDCDCGPTKAFLVSHRDDAAVKPFAERALGKRRVRELDDLRSDPYELKDIAEDPAYADTLKDLDVRLMAELKATGDPRATANGDIMETYLRHSPIRKFPLPKEPLPPRSQRNQ